MKFTPTWYKQDVADIPSFQELEDITGSAYDEQGVYIGPKEKPDMQLVMDRRTNRQYWAPKEYDEDAIKYSTARMEQNFNSQEWWGMVRDPHLTFGQKISTAYIEGLKQAGKLVANAPTKIVAAATGLTDAVGIDAGNLAKAAFINNPTNLPIYLASSLARKGVKATAEDYLQLLKDIKTPSGQMGETASLYRASAQNWQSTLDKYLPDVDENIKAHSTLVAIGSMAGQVGGSLLLAAATSHVGGMAAVAGVFGSQQFYDIREEYLSKGYSLDSANIYAGLAAIAEGGLEALGFTKWLKYATLKPSLRNHLIAGFMEASQEALQTTAEETITNLSGVREETLTEILAQIAISAVAGFIPGAGLSVVSGGVGIRQEKAAYELDNAVENTANIVPQKQQTKPQPQEGSVIKGTTPKQELELAKANKGSNQLYEVVKNIADSYGVTDEKVIDGLYYFARNQAVQGKVGEELLEGLGNQLVAYKNQLSATDKKADKENKEAAADIAYHLSQEAADKFHSTNVKAMEESGIEKQKAEVAASQLDIIYKNLSEKLGIDLQQFKQVIVRALPQRQEGAAKEASGQEATNEINAILRQIRSLEKLGTPEALAQKERLQAELDEKVDQEGKRGYISLGDTINEIVLGRNSDISTLQHEMMHHFRNVINLMAAKGNKEAIALKAQMDKIIEAHKDEVKQGINKEEEVLSEAYEAWLYGGVVSEDPTQQKLFDALKQFFNDVYDSVKAITGIRIDPEIDMFFRQLTGEMDIQQRAAEGQTMFQEGIKYDKNGKADINSPEFKKWFGNSKVVDENGAPLVVYHGTNAKNIQQFDKNKASNVYGSRNGFFFAKREQDAGYGHTVMPVYLSMQNPYVVDVAQELSQLDYDIKTERAEAEAAGYPISRWEGKGSEEFEANDSATAYLDDNYEEIFSRANEGNYDGVIVKGVDGSETYVAFEPTQIKSVYNKGTFDEKNPNIYYQGERDLYATHNMNLAGAKQALKLGGLAMPSMALRRLSAGNVNDFGEVSFVAIDKMVKPSRGTEVYDRDAWTPSIWNNIKYALSKNAKNKIESILKKSGEEKKTSMYVYNIAENLYDATRNELALDLYMKEKGLPDDSERWKIYDSTEYIKWYNENLFDDATPYLYTENDDNTDMVNRKMSLNNIMKILRRKERAAGGYIGDHLFSVGELVKFFPQKFRNLDEIRAKKGNLAGREEIQKKIDELDEAFDALVKDMRTEGKEKEYGADKHAVGIAIVNFDKKENQLYFLKSAGLRTDDNAISEINKFAERLKNEIPVDYFEVKPRRVVGFSEFAGVIMPKTAEYDSLAKQLDEEYFLPVLRIEKGNVEQYKQALSELQQMYPNVYFQDREQAYRDDRAQRTGAKAADPKPSKERIARDLQVIRNKGVEKYEPKSKLGRSLGDWGKHILLTVRQRAGAIDPKIKAFFDKLDYFQPNLEKKFASKANGFIKKFQGLTEVEKDEFDYYIYNQCHEELNAFLKEKGMEKEYNEVRQLLNFIYAKSNQLGIDMGFVNEYFPTSMIDYAGFLDYIKGTDKWSYIQKALKEADPQGVWSDKEKAEAINKLLRGYRMDPVSKPKNAKERTILYKSPELMKFYEHSDVALIKYLQGMSQAIAINKAFGKGGGFDTDETIGAVVLDLINSGTITNKEEAEIKRLLKSRLSYGATPEFIAMVKNVGYLQTMNNITSAVTQLGDLYAPFYKYSFGTAIKSIFGKAEITKTDLGLDKIWEEFSDSSKTGIAVDKLFKVIGLEKMDSFGKNVAINASLLNLREQAAKGNIELTNRLAYTFGKDAQKVLADIKAGKVTEEVKTLIWADLADTQPIGRSGVPTGYLDNPHGRLFYQLKTFSLNQISLFYADSLVNIQKGIKYKNKAQFLKGVQNGFKLLLLLTAGNAGADVLKNLIMGRDIDISDTVVSNLLWNIGVSKYTFYKGKRDGYARALLSSYLMPPQLSAADDMLIDVRNIAGGKKQLKDSAAVTYLPYGRAYYWWFGGGSKQGKERTAKMKKKAAAENRKKKKPERKKKK